MNPDQEPVLLAIETSGMYGSIALVNEYQCLSEYTLHSRRTHSQRLLESISWMFKEAGLEWPGISGIAISLGPGSFTGLRIGLSTAKGLAMATGLPLLGVAALDGLAAQFSYAGTLICPVLDARRKEVYAAFYRCGRLGQPQRVSDYLVLPPERLAAMISEPVILAGDGASLYEEVFRAQLQERAIIAPAAIYFPRAASVGYLAFNDWIQEKFLDPATITPIYIRASEAEIKFGA